MLYPDGKNDYASAFIAAILGLVCVSSLHQKRFSSTEKQLLLWFVFYGCLGNHLLSIF
jgi:hypothetical protein